MHHWSQLGIRNWRAKPGRTAGAVGAIALGVGVVIWVTCAYESVRLALRDQAWFWIGRSHLAVEANPEGGTVYQSIADEAAKLPNVQDVTYRLRLRMILDKVAASTTPSEVASGGRQDQGRPESELASTDDSFLGAEGVEVQAIGIRPELEGPFRDYGQDRIAGRMLETSDTDSAVIDGVLAAEAGLKIGDRFRLRAAQLESGGDPTEKSATFTVVGLFEHRRIAKQQRPVVLLPLERVQALAGFDRHPRLVSKIEVRLADASLARIQTAERDLIRVVGKYGTGMLVTNAAGKLAQVNAAEQQTQFIMLLISSVALFTAFFIILSTLSMGMVERIGQLGTLRCLGMTRWQLAVLVLGEASVVGGVGILLGIPIGLGLGKITVYVAKEYIGYFAVSHSGMMLAITGGAVTTLAGAVLPMFQTLRVSPLAASRVQSQPTPGILAWVFGAVGVAMILRHEWMLAHIPANKLYHSQNALLAVALLYGGYAFVVPAVIRIAGFVTVRVAAAVMRLRYRLLADQVGKAVWRSSAICCGLMVGLSLIVTLIVHSESIAAGWDFPSGFFEAYVYVNPPVNRAKAEDALLVGGVRDGCLVNPTIRCTVYGKGLFNFPTSFFIAGDPDKFFQTAHLTFVAGTKEEALAKLRRGGYILVTPEFVRSKKLGYGDRVPIRASRHGTVRVFEIAAVVRSPALDVAANYFNAGDQLATQSVHAVLGTFADAHKQFDLPDEASLFLFNFDMPTTAVPPEFAALTPPDVHDAMRFADLLEQWRPLMPERSEELDRVAAEVRALGPQGRVHWLQVKELRTFREGVLAVASEWRKRSPEQRWQMFREELAMELVGRRSGAIWPPIHGSVRALKQQIDRDLRRATRLFAAIPVVALVVAALGVGNLMMANVASRSRQLATLRAVGATQWQITRLVIGEALVLGTLGCAVGVALGLHAATSINHMIELIWGYQPVWTIPFQWLGLSIGFTFLVCLIAGMIPASRAARSNIIAALQTT